MHPDGSKKLCSGMLTRSFKRWRNRPSRLRLSSSAHTLYSPAWWVTRKSMRCSAAQPAASFRNVPRGSAVLQSFSVLDSTAVLSDALGSANFQVLAPSALRAAMASASCAMVSKHAMYCCGCAVSCSHSARIWSAVHVSANQAQCGRDNPASDAQCQLAFRLPWHLLLRSMPIAVLAAVA